MRCSEQHTVNLQNSHLVDMMVVKVEFSDLPKYGVNSRNSRNVKICMLLKGSVIQYFKNVMLTVNHATVQH